jgi:hypothetical protein
VLAGGKDLNLRPLGYEFCSPFLLLLVSSSLSNTYLLKPFGDSWCFLLVLVATGRNSGRPAATRLTAYPALLFLSRRVAAHHRHGRPLQPRGRPNGDSRGCVAEFRIQRMQATAMVLYLGHAYRCKGRDVLITLQHPVHLGNWNFAPSINCFDCAGSGKRQ